MSQAIPHTDANELQGDRDIPQLGTDKKKNNLTKLIVSAGLLAAVVSMAGGAILFIHRLEENKKAEVALRDSRHQKDTPPVPKNFDSTKLRIKKEEAAMLPPPVSAIPVSFATPASSGVAPAAGVITSAATPTARVATETPEQRALTGSVLVALGSENESPTVAAVDRRDVTSTQGTPPKDGLDDKLRPSALIAGRAVTRPDLGFLLRRGTMIECGQKTRIVTTYSGMVACQVSKDVYSANGEVLLIERGSEVFGEQRKGLMQGQAAIEVLWTRVDTPSGVVIDINSLGTDTLGASGHPAEVDNHIGQRFGGAVLLSLIGDIGQALSTRSSGNGGQFNFNSTANAGHDIAAKTLESTINIPPTAYSMHGSAINIFVARDIDFRSVYELSRN